MVILDMDAFFLFLILALFISGLGLLVWMSRQQKRIGMPGGRVIYVDMRTWSPVEKPLYDPDTHLTGRPDYLVQHGDQIIPVEVKSSQVGSGPYDSHIYQLAAYCLLVERQFGKRPPYGILHYPNRTFAVDYTPQLEHALMAVLDQLHTLERRKEIHRSHDSSARCQACGYRYICNQPATGL